jgi:hypothetical protein
MGVFFSFISSVLLIASLSFASVPAALGQVRQPGPTGPSDEALQSDDERSTTPSATNLAPVPANISGTVIDVNGGIVPGAVITLEGATASDRQTATSSGSGAFQFTSLKPGIAYLITVSATGFEPWRSPVVTLNPGQYFILENIKLKLPHAITNVKVYSSTEQIATEQVIVEEHQRVFGVFPNFYVSYDQDAVPLTTKLKFRLAYKADTDVVTFFGVAFMATIYQAGDIPDYGQGWDAYGKRVAAGYADTTTDIFIGGAILPWILHQDPRYFYQGTGTTKSRVRHAMFSPFICRGDNGKPQPNYSSLGGDLASGAISNFYYPESNRGAGLVFQGFAVTTGVRMVNGLIQEFLLRKLTPSARHQN